MPGGSGSSLAAEGRVRGGRARDDHGKVMGSQSMEGSKATTDSKRFPLIFMESLWGVEHSSDLI